MANLITYTPSTTVAEGIFATNMVNTINGTLDYLKSSQKVMMDAMWTPDNLTVQQHFDSLGADAGKVFSLSSALSDFIISLDATYTAPKPADYGYTYVIHDDGTVTVTATS